MKIVSDCLNKKALQDSTGYLNSNSGPYKLQRNRYSKVDMLVRSSLQSPLLRLGGTLGVGRSLQSLYIHEGTLWTLMNSPTSDWLAFRPT